MVAIHTSRGVCIVDNSKNEKVRRLLAVAATRLALRPLVVAHQLDGSDVSLDKQLLANTN
ncbi:hypothetical protein HK100_004971, partial [Physocladia obscura]